MGLLVDARAEFHATLLSEVLSTSADGIASNADRGSKWSRQFALGIVERIGAVETREKLVGQTSGAKFEVICAAFLQRTFPRLSHLRNGSFDIVVGGGISQYKQFAHLDDLQEIARSNQQIATALGSDYLIKPDIVVSRRPESDAAINAIEPIVDANIARAAAIRGDLDDRPILHASVSCKWTLRSDRAQNARSEGLNLVRNRKGTLPHVVVMTGEPLPSRIASLALGTGDIDCVYHFALPELRDTLSGPGLEGYLDTLDMMIDGARLKDIADLPLDLAV